ncbi:hypothetical protein [Pseudomonas yamanorum]|uniref:hypothetical protein n=1 Tax=Pseudomonas yamanorum TaxID=515393 RepID=UPI003F75674A
MTDYQRDFKNFRFPGFGKEGSCFLRVRVKEGKSIFLCAQLRDYTGTSVTNAVEEIFVKIVGILNDEGIYKREKKHWYSFRRFVSYESIASQSRWIEYYPKGTGIFGDDSYAIVSFDSNLSPVWNYVSLERAAQECGVTPDFFTVSSEDLQYV